MRVRLKVFAALFEDVNNGWIWVPKDITANRGIAKIIDTDSGRSVFCEVIPIGDNFTEHYNNKKKTAKINKTSSIAINEWYRNKLGIQTKQERDFEIKIINDYWSRLRASLAHPQIIVRIAIELAIVSVFLGFCGLISGIISLYK